MKASVGSRSSDGVCAAFQELAGRSACCPRRRHPQQHKVGRCTWKMVLLCGRGSPRNQKVSRGSPSMSLPEVLAAAPSDRWAALPLAAAAAAALAASAALARRLREAAAA